MCSHATKRLSVFSNLCSSLTWTGLINCAHARIGYQLTLEGKRATGVEIAFDGKIHASRLDSRLFFRLGAMHTPKC